MSTTTKKCQQQKNLKKILKKWDKVFKDRPTKTCGRQPLKNLIGYGVFKQTISLQIFKGCLPQNLLGPFLNTLSYLKLSPGHSESDFVCFKLTL